MKHATRFIVLCLTLSLMTSSLHALELQATPAPFVLKQATVAALSQYEMKLLIGRIERSRSSKIVVYFADGQMGSFLNKNEGSFAERLVCFLAGQGWTNCVQ